MGAGQDRSGDKLKQFKKILAVASTGRTAGQLLRRLGPLMRANNAKLTILSSIELPKDVSEFRNSTISPKELLTAIKKHRTDELANAIEEELPNDYPCKLKVVSGKPLQEIIREASRGKYDLIAKMAEGKGDLGALFFGTLDQKLMRKSATPILIIKRDRYQVFDRILSAVQLNDDDLGDFFNEQEESFQFNAEILEAASSVARAESGDLHIVNAWSFFAEGFLKTKRGYDRAVKDILTEINADHHKAMEQLVSSQNLEGINYQTHVFKGDASDVIIRAAQKFDAGLIVLGTIGRVGIPGFFIGNTAETVLSNTKCSVLTLKPKGFVSPIL